MHVADWSTTAKYKKKQDEPNNPKMDADKKQKKRSIIKTDEVDEEANEEGKKGEQT